LAICKLKFFKKILKRTTEKSKKDLDIGGEHQTIDY